MNQSLERPIRFEDEFEPTWEIAYLFPGQGTWTEGEYLSLNTNHLVELSDGFLEVLPSPTTSHQLLVFYLCTLLSQFVTSRDLGLALFAGIRVRLWRDQFREPDIVFMLKDHADRMGEEFWKGADLVMEVVSAGKKDQIRDLKEKRADYARARIPEYWIVDPQEKRITVLRLAGKRYVVHGTFDQGETASSHLLPGFSVNVAEAFAQAVLPSAKGKPARTGKRKRGSGKG